MSELKRVRGGRVLVETVSEVVTVSLFLFLSLSPSLHRHLQECSEGLKASHWPNAQDECVSQPALQPATSSHQPKQGAQEKLL